MCKRTNTFTCEVCHVREKEGQGREKLPDPTLLTFVVLDAEHVFEGQLDPRRVLDRARQEFMRGDDQVRSGAERPVSDFCPCRATKLWP